MDRSRILSSLINYSSILIIIIFFILPVAILFFLNPDSFQLVWEARTPYILFVWFFGLEIALAYRRFKSRVVFEKRILAAIIAMTIPTIYVVATSFWGLNNVVSELGKSIGVPYLIFGKWFIDVSWPISLEYLVFASSFTLTVVLVYGFYGLKGFLAAIFFIWSTAIFFILNTFAPYGIVGALQVFVPLTTRSAARILELLGFRTLVGEISDWRGPGVLLTVMGGNLSFSAAVYWPSAGIQSLVIYSGMILLFIKDTSYSLLRKILYVVVGAMGTFATNIFRIVTIFVVGLKIGNVEASIFHDNYGELFFISWIIVYLVLIVYGSSIVNRTRKVLKKH
ncbi:MAG: hypothetical protein QG670_1764 [Thermoproteota archaeon]|nr:hypothetical protein [Thermoproteota archaeon]